MRAWAVVLTVVLLAGCSGGDRSAEAPQAQETTAASADVPPRLPQVVFTETLHFAGPTLTPVPPLAGALEPVLVDIEPLPTQVQQNDIVSRALWTYTFQGAGPLTSLEARLWVRVDRQLVNPFQGPALCPWGFWVEVQDGTGQTVHTQRPCLPDGAVVAAGDREMVFAAGDLGIEVEQGWVLGVGFEAGPWDPAAPTSVAVHLLTGTSAFDSRIVLAGLREPIPGTGA